MYPAPAAQRRIIAETSRGFLGLSRRENHGHEQVHAVVEEMAGLAARVQLWYKKSPLKNTSEGSYHIF